MYRDKTSRRGQMAPVPQLPPAEFVPTEIIEADPLLGDDPRHLGLV